jgi:hypothetical protein
VTARYDIGCRVPKARWRVHRRCRKRREGPARCRCPTRGPAQSRFCGCAARRSSDKCAKPAADGCVALVLRSTIAQAVEVLCEGRSAVAQNRQLAYGGMCRLKRRRAMLGSKPLSDRPAEGCVDARCVRPGPRGGSSCSGTAFAFSGRLANAGHADNATGFRLLRLCRQTIAPLSPHRCARAMAQKIPGCGAAPHVAECDHRQHRTGLAANLS